MRAGAWRGVDEGWGLEGGGREDKGQAKKRQPFFVLLSQSTNPQSTNPQSASHAEYGCKKSHMLQ